jgi:prepilin-type N-terminal cleavage/methylation domain-containing protein
MRSAHRSAFTLLEVLAVLFLLAIVFSASLGTFSGAKSRLKSASQTLTKDLQTLAVMSQRESKIIRVVFESEKTTQYSIEFYEPPLKAPTDPEDREAQKIWEEHQQQIASLSSAERASRTRLDRGKFKLFKSKELPSGVEWTRVFSTAPHETDSKTYSILFSPTGEVSLAAIVLSAGENYQMTLWTQPLSGRVIQESGALTEQDWRQRAESR